MKLVAERKVESGGEERQGNISVLGEFRSRPTRSSFQVSSTVDCTMLDMLGLHGGMTADDARTTRDYRHPVAHRKYRSQLVVRGAEGEQ
jgi:hypothetical protein